MDADARPGQAEPGTASARETTAEDLLAMISRMAASDPHCVCHVGSGALAPVAAALNKLALQLTSGHLKSEDAFGIRTLVEQSPNIMFTCDVHARIRYVNFTLPGLTVADVIGDDLYKWIAPDTVEAARSAIQGVLTTGEIASYEARPTLSSGGEWYTNRVGPIRAGHEIVGFTVIITDITHLKKTQFRLEESNRELESFAYVASHDLQEPLRKIHIFGERLKAKSSAMSPEGRDYIERMQNAAARMRNLIDDLLSFARVSSNALPFTQVDLAVIAREVLADLEPRIEQSGASITLGELPVLEADATQMRQLIQNLVGNAIKFRREGVPPVISIRGTVDSQTQQCELAVQDNGIGFDEKYYDSIFIVFQRLHGRGQYEGTGIGLAICRKIAERHNGHIRARSVPGAGATFSVTLPLKQHTSR